MKRLVGWHQIAICVRGEWTNLPRAPWSRNVALAEQAIGRVEIRNEPSGSRTVMWARERSK